MDWASLGMFSDGTSQMASHEASFLSTVVLPSLAQRLIEEESVIHFVEVPLHVLRVTPMAVRAGAVLQAVRITRGGLHALSTASAAASGIVEVKLLSRHAVRFGRFGVHRRLIAVEGAQLILVGVLHFLLRLPLSQRPVVGVWKDGLGIDWKAEYGDQAKQRRKFASFAS